MRALSREAPALAFVALATAFLVVTGLAGVDFGNGQWDEPANIARFAWGLKHHAPLARDYAYPTGLIAVIAATALPWILGFVARPDVTTFVLEVRSVLVVVTALIVPATYVLARNLGRPRLESALAAALVATSFEFATNARYISPDALTALACTASLAFLVKPVPRLRDVVIGAALGGVAASTKYTVAILAVPIAIAACRSAGLTSLTSLTSLTGLTGLTRLTGPSGNSAVTRHARISAAKRVALAALVMIAAFVVVTPAAVIEPGLIVAALKYQSRVYGGGFPGYTVDGAVDMAFHIARYALFRLASPFLGCAVVVAVAGVAGVALAAHDAARIKPPAGPERPDRVDGVVLAAGDAARPVPADGARLVPAGGVDVGAAGGAVVSARFPLEPLVFALLLVALFLTQRTFIPRNLLPILPVVALFAGRAATSLIHAWRRDPSSQPSTTKRRRAADVIGVAVAVVVAAVAVVDAGYLAFAASTIRGDRAQTALDEVAAFADAHPDEVFLASPAIRDSVARPNLVAPSSQANATRVIAVSNELLLSWKWHGGDPFLFDKVFGAREVDFTLYPTWNTPHAVLMSIAKARALGASVDDFKPPPEPQPETQVDKSIYHEGDR